MKRKKESTIELYIHELYDICQPDRKKKWSGFYIKKEGPGDKMVGILWIFLNFHLKFLIISLSEDAYLRVYSVFIYPLDPKKSCYIFLRVFGLHQKRKTGWK